MYEYKNKTVCARITLRAYHSLKIIAVRDTKTISEVVCDAIDAHIAFKNISEAEMGK